MARYLVTGGAGFIGSNLVRRLCTDGEAVRVVDDLSTGRRWLLERAVGARTPQVELLVGDIRDVSLMRAAMAGVDVVLHHAADGSVPRSLEDPLRTDAINVQGTLNVLERAREAGVSRVVFASSSAVYGFEPTLPKRESSVVEPWSPYAVSKLAGEAYMQMYARLHNLSTVCLRYFNVFGPGQLPDGPYAAAIPRFIVAALEGRPVTLFGDGEQTRDFCFVSNVVDANLLAARSSRRFAGDVINVAGGRATTLNNLLAVLEGLLGHRVERRHEPPRPGDIKHSSADTSGARELLGQAACLPFEEGLAPTIDFLRELLSQGSQGAAAREAVRVAR